MRALGALPTSNQIGVFGVLLRNNTSGTLTKINVSYTGEQWRRGDVTTPDALTFEYGVATSLEDTGLTADTDLAFTSPNVQAAPASVALDGNAAANHTALSKAISGISSGEKRARSFATSAW